MRRLLAALALVVAPAFAAELPTLAVALRYLDGGSTSVAGLTSAASTVEKFWNVNSAGKHTFPMTVHPAVLQLNKNKPTGTYCNYSFMGDAYNAIVAAGIDLTKYKRAIIVMPMRTVCPYKGFQSYLTTGIAASFTSSTNVQYIAHEMGHTLGLGHANSITYKSPLGVMEPLNLTKCWTAEYGAAYDIMAKNLMLSNPVHRAKIGIALPTVHAMGEATYTLAPATEAAKVMLANGRSLWVEYRQQVSYDSRMPWANTQGALVWAVGSYGGGTPPSGPKPGRAVPVGLYEGNPQPGQAALTPQQSGRRAWSKYI